MACVFASALPANAQTDLYGAMESIDRELADAPGLPRSGFACPQPEPGKPLMPEGTVLDLPSALDRALCANPRVRQAWAIARFRAAQVGGAKAADMPTLSLSGQWNRAGVTTEVDDLQALNSTRYREQRNVSVALNWVLYDAGLRAGNISVAEQTLVAAREGQRATLLAVVEETGHAYYDWWAAIGNLEAAAEAERTAQRSVDIAVARQQIGSATIVDRLQAETALAQATLDRVEAESTLSTAKASLATLLAIEPGELPQRVDIRGLRPQLLNDTLAELTAQAQALSPTLREARAQLDVALARITVADANNAPVLTLTGSMLRNQQDSNALGQSFTTKAPGISLQLSVPLFDGGAQSYQRHAARSQAEVSRESLASVQRQIVLDVWKVFHDMGNQVQKVKMTRALVASASQADKVAETRYRAGAGTLLDLLNARNALAAAHKQAIQAGAAWRIARIKLVVLCAQPLRWEPDDGQ